MKGLRNVGRYDTKKTMTDTLIYKSLPYGKWTTADECEYLFNRDYEPILGWDNKTSAAIPVLPTTWIRDIVNAEHYYGEDVDYPTESVKTMRKCMNILADWNKKIKL